MTQGLDQSCTRVSFCAQCINLKFCMDSTALSLVNDTGELATEQYYISLYVIIGI